MNQPNNDLNEQARLAWEIIETTNTNLFLTGKAGTGKTTFLRRLKNESSKRIVVVAPTGIAAINAEGVTIHSFFQLSFAPFIPNAQYKLKEQQYKFSRQKIRVIQSIDTLVIDEISWCVPTCLTLWMPCFAASARTRCRSAAFRWS